MSPISCLIVAGVLLVGGPGVAWAQRPAPRPPRTVVPLDSLHLRIPPDSALRRLAVAIGARSLPACPMPVSPGPIADSGAVAPHRGRVPYMPAVRPGCRNPLYHGWRGTLDSLRVERDTTH